MRHIVTIYLSKNILYIFLSTGTCYSTIWSNIGPRQFHACPPPPLLPLYLPIFSSNASPHPFPGAQLLAFSLVDLRARTYISAQAHTHIHTYARTSALLGFISLSVHTTTCQPFTFLYDNFIIIFYSYSYSYTIFSIMIDNHIIILEMIIYNIYYLQISTKPTGSTS